MPSKRPPKRPRGRMQPDAQASADEWLASAERFAADADYFESDPLGPRRGQGARAAPARVCSQSSAQSRRTAEGVPMKLLLAHECLEPG